MSFIFEECCKFHLWWIPNSPCRGNFPGLGSGSNLFVTGLGDAPILGNYTGGSTTTDDVIFVPALSNKWYVEYYEDDDYRCVMECEGPPPCNGQASGYKELYGTFEGEFLSIELKPLGI